MTIILPATPLPTSATPTPLVFGAWQTPSLGGVETWLQRLGNRMSLAIVTPNLKPEPDGRLWTSALLQAWNGGLDVQMSWPQTEFQVGSPGAPRVDGASQAGSILNLRGMTAGYVIRERQAFTCITNGIARIYFATAATTVASTGKAALPIVPMLRAPPNDGDNCNFATPFIVGRLGGDAKSWTLVRARTQGLSFTILERQ